MEHTIKCKEAQRDWRIAYAQFKAEHPDYCEACGGWGIHMVGGRFNDSEACPECVEKDKCPHCGGKIQGESLVWCNSCSFKLDFEHISDYQSNSKGIPPQPECYCFQDEIDQMIAEAEAKADEIKERLEREHQQELDDLFTLMKNVDVVPATSGYAINHLDQLEKVETDTVEKRMYILRQLTTGVLPSIQNLARYAMLPRNWVEPGFNIEAHLTAMTNMLWIIFKSHARAMKLMRKITNNAGKQRIVG